MKINRVLFLLGILSVGVSCWAATWPDSCGPEKASFDVTTQEAGTAPSQPTASKARIIFLEDENQMIGPFMYATVRFGVDGKWVGATKGSSYFAVDVAPGEHHVCANWQSHPAQLEDHVGLTYFTAEPGKTYYFSAHVRVASRYAVFFGLSKLNSDQGQFMAGNLKVAVAAPK